ncbi:SGNH/GDSL hydrolase family protein [bacterium]|nr:SGNH/GDSL hydrolase family protein [bacterium]
MKKTALILSALLLFYLTIELSLFFVAVKQMKSPFEHNAAKVYSNEEWKIAREMIDTLNDFGMEAYSLPGTKLYLHKPFKSKLYNINSLRFRGKEVSKKEKNEVRIALIGDSNIWGMMAPDSMTIPAQIEQELQKRFPQVKITVLNLGVEAYAINRMKYLLSYYFDTLNPDMLLFFTGTGDIVFSHIFSTHHYAAQFPADDKEIPIKNPIFIEQEQSSFALFLQQFRTSRLLLNQITNHFNRIEKQATKSVKQKNNRNRASDQFAEKFLEDKEALEKFAQQKGVPALFFLSPTASTKQFLTDDEKILVKEARIALKKPGITEFTLSTYKNLLQQQQASNLISLLDIFDDYHQSIYFDEVHFNYQGLTMVAHAMEESIRKDSAFLELVAKKEKEGKQQ